MGCSDSQATSSNNIDPPKRITSFSCSFQIENLHSKNITSLLILTNKQIATGSKDGSLYITSVDISSKTRTCLIQKQNIHDNAITSLCEIVEHNYLISASDDESIKIWELSQNDLLLVKTLLSHTKSIRKLIMFSDKLRFASCSEDESIKIWNSISPFNEIVSLKEDEPVISIMELKHNLNNNILVSCCWGYITLWNSKTYTKEKTINDVSINSSNGLIELPNGNISLSDNNSIIIVNPCKASIIKVIKDDHLISWGTLSLLNEQSFIYVCQGSFVHISADTFKIMFRARIDKGDLVGEAGVCLEEKGKYAVIDNEYGGFGFFEFEYNI